MKNVLFKKQAHRAGRILANHVNLLILLIMVQTFTACNDGTLQDSDNQAAPCKSMLL